MHNQHVNPARLFPDKNTKAVFVQEGVYVRGCCKTSSYNLGETVTPCSYHISIKTGSAQSRQSIILQGIIWINGSLFHLIMWITR